MGTENAPQNETEYLEKKLQADLTEFVVEGGEIRLDRLDTALKCVRSVHNKLIDKAGEILAKKKV